MQSPAGGLGIRGIASIDLFLKDLERSRRHFGQALDFAEVALSSPSWEALTGERTVVMAAGDARVALHGCLDSRGEAYEWLDRHPEGVGRISFLVEDAQQAFITICMRGGTPLTSVQTRDFGAGAVSWFDIVTPIGSTVLRFVQAPVGAQVVPGTVALPELPRSTNRFAIGAIDHITCNFLTLKPVILWMEQVLGLERYWGVEFHTQEVQGALQDDDSGSGLKSIVMWDPTSGVKFANNEPAAPRFKASQIYTFCRDHRGAGVQHIALTVGDLVGSVQQMQQQGLAFVPTPAAYYQHLPARLTAMGIDALDEEISRLMELGVLVDGAGPKQYLLQIFMREAAALFGDASAGPLFLELIQRKGDKGFGAGNFRALFESIERQQSSAPPSDVSLVASVAPAATPAASAPLTH